ncbi:hypothetical protein BMETH_36401232141861, partial [methanotrophic bacterial endosymbiont of Bathymodiolus sp.]
MTKNNSLCVFEMTNKNNILDTFFKKELSVW